ncbi:MAG: hypothetical protein Q7S40_13695 [Opitutaceae bacterium]|nr:hypothetical protein [Opitutaceae bacterium]
MDSEKPGPARHASQRHAAAVLAVLIGLGWGVAICRAQPPNVDVQGAQVLTRGPVHEAFAGMITFNPEPGIVVPKSPPGLIEEVPPAERPEGDNVAWIPGYWAWDDERSDFLWVSGTWRALPPGREWMAGYWGQTRQGHQWISGYWADATVREATYLPPPPATVEAGPNIAAPSFDYGWTPGSWIWYQGRYAWRPGYWAQSQADWDWIPAHYIWTPRGYLFVEGFWDYPVERRGILFAPVYFDAGVYSRRGYYYSPMIVINLAVFGDHLFLRPRYQHYYFGDYYASSYNQDGYYASYSFQSSRYGYDPFFSRQRWVHRQDREWEHRVEVAYQYRRDNVAARPPRTWAAQRNINPTAAASLENRVQVAISIEQLARSKDSPVRFQPVAREERQQLVQRRQEVQTSRVQRSALEARAEDTKVRSPGAIMEPVKVPLPRSPIVAKPASQLRRNQAPPAAPQPPKPDLKVGPRFEPPARQTSADRSNPQPEPRQLGPEKKSAPVRGVAAPRERQAQQESERRAKESAVKAQEEAQRNARGMAQKAQQESERRAEPTGRTAEDSKPNARGMDKKTQKQSEQSAKVAAVKAQEEAQRKAKELEENAQEEPPPPAKGAPAADEKDTAKPARKGQQNPGKGKSSPEAGRGP